MKLRTLMLTWLVILMSGCVGHDFHKTSKPYLASDIIVVPENHRRDYWVMERLSYLPRAVSQPMCARVQVVIDSNGRLFAPKLMEAKGGKQAYAVMLDFMSHVHFRPAKTNPKRIPIRTELAWSFNVSSSFPSGTKAEREKFLRDMRMVSCAAK